MHPFQIRILVRHTIVGYVRGPPYSPIFGIHLQTRRGPAGWLENFAPAGASKEQNPGFPAWARHPPGDESRILKKNRAILGGTP